MPRQSTLSPYYERVGASDGDLRHVRAFAAKLTINHNGLYCSWVRMGTVAVNENQCLEAVQCFVNTLEKLRTSGRQITRVEVGDETAVFLRWQSNAPWRVTYYNSKGQWFVVPNGFSVMDRAYNFPLVVKLGGNHRFKTFEGEECLCDVDIFQG